LLDAMSNKPFDPVRACFYLIAAVIGVHALVVLMGVAACLFYAPEVLSGKFSCDKDSRLSELLSAALSAALAFAGGFMRNPPPPPPRAPEGE
jgi:hypothetical protein